MKKLTKLLILVLSVALIVGAIVMVASAEETDEIRPDVENFPPTAAWGYVDANDDTQWTDRLGDATANAKDKSVIVLSKELTESVEYLSEYKTPNTVNEKGETVFGNGKAYATVASGTTLTIDLQGHNYDVLLPQKFIRISVNGNLTMKNGTINVSFTQEYAEERDLTPDRNSPFFQMDSASSVLTLENMTTYSGALIYQYGSATASACPKVVINGGTHYVTRLQSDANGGIVASRSNIEAEFNNATFYVANGTYGIISSASYIALRDAKIPPKSTFKFNGCTIITETGTQKVVECANDKTYIEFKDTRIYGSLSTPILSSDAEYSELNPIAEGNITFVGKTYIGGSAVSDAVITPDNVGKLKVVSYSKTETIPAVEVCKDAEENELALYLGTFTTESKDVSATYTLCFTDDGTCEGDVIENVVYVYGATADGLGKIKYSTDENALSTIVSEVTTSSTIHVLKDVTVTVGKITSSTDSNGNTTYSGNSSNINITKAMTVDLLGHELKLKQNYKNSYINVNTTNDTNNEVKFKNGIMTAGYSEEAATQVKADSGTLEQSYAMFYTANWTSGGKTYTKANIVLENITSYSGQMFSNYGRTDAKFTVIGGEHHVTRAQNHGVNGFINSRTNVEFTATDAIFYVTEGAGGLLSSMSYVGTRNADLELKSNFTFNNCKILSDNPGTNLIEFANEFTYVNFNGCDVYASVSGAKLHEWDVSSTSNGKVINAIKPGNVKFDANCSFSDSSHFDESVAFPEGFALTSSDAAYSSTLTFVKDGAYVGNGTFETEEKAYTCKFSVKMADVTGGAFKYFNKTGNQVLYATADMTLNDVANYASDKAPITLLGDVTYPLGATLVLEHGFTLDLDGHTLSIVQKKGATININTAEKITVINGKIVTSYSEAFDYSTGNDYSPPAGSTGASSNTTAEPLFTVAINDAKLGFEDVDFYGASLVYSEANTGMAVDILRGEYHSVYTALTGESALLAAPDMILNVKDAKIYASEKSALANLDAAATSELSFENSTVVASSAIQNMVNTAASANISFTDCVVAGRFVPTSGKVTLSADNITASGSKFKNYEIDDGYNEENPAGDTFDVVFNFSTGSLANGNFETAEGTKTYYIGKIIAKPETFTVIWYKADGTKLSESAAVAPGTVVTPPAYEPEVGVSNGWYTTTSYDGWAKSIGGEKVVDFTITENTSFYPRATGTPAARLTSALYNLSFYGSVGVHFYLPYDVPAAVEIEGVYYANGEEITGTKTTFMGAYYTVYNVGKVGVANLADAEMNINVVFTVDGTELTQEITLRPAAYVNTVLGSETYASAHTLIADLVRYSNTLSIAAKGESDATLDAILAQYGDKCSKLPSPTEFTMHTTSALDLKDYLEYVTFAISADQPRYLLGFKSGSKVVGVTFSLDGYLDVNSSYGVNFGKVTYGYAADSQKDGNYLTTAYSADIPIYNLDRDVTITLSLEGGKTVSGTYSVNEYYSGMLTNGEITDAKKEEYKEFLRTLRAFAISGASYRYPYGELSGGAKVEFWDCDHNSEYLGRLSFTDGRFCSNCATHVFFYGDFGATGNGSTNDYGAAYMAHTAANAYAIANPDAKVGVVARGVGNNTFVFAEPMKTATAAHNGSIPIKTDTDWSEVEFIFEDRVIKQYSVASRNPVFTLATDDASVNYAEDVTSISAGATNIGYAPGKAMLIYLVNNDIKHYFRHGANANDGQYRQEVILVDEFGNVDPTTPVEWDYEKLSSVTAYPAYDRPITVSGLDDNGEISCRIITKANHDVVTPGYVSTHRGITISRSNVKIGGIYHELEEIHSLTLSRASEADINRYNEGIAALNEQGYDLRTIEEIIAGQTETSKLPADYIRRTAYNGIRLDKANGVVIHDMSVENHFGRDDDVGTALGSYEFSGGTASNVAYVRCETRNMFHENAYGSDGAATNKVGKLSYRGMFGTNYMRNMYFKDCYLNSMDAHSGAYNVTIEDSIFEHMNFVGGGDIIIKNTTVYMADGTGGAIRLRDDYGSQWHGDIYVDGLTIVHSSEKNNQKQSLIYGWTYDHSFGPYDKSWTENVTENGKPKEVTRYHTTTYMPTNVTVKNVTLKTFDYVENADGTYSMGELRNSTNNFYYYGKMYGDTTISQFKYNTYTPTETLNIIVDAGTDAAAVKWYWTNQEDIMSNMTVNVTVIKTDGTEVVQNGVAAGYYTFASEYQPK